MGDDTVITEKRCNEYRKQIQVLLEEKEKRFVSEQQLRRALMQKELQSLAKQMEAYSKHYLTEDRVLELVTEEMGRPRDLMKGTLPLHVVAAIVLNVVVLSSIWFAMENRISNLEKKGTVPIEKRTNGGAVALNHLKEEKKNGNLANVP